MRGVSYELSWGLKGNLSVLKSHEGSHEGLNVALISRSDALTIYCELEQTANFLWRFNVPLKPGVLTGGCCLLVKRFEKSREANHVCIVTT